jgi:hypothetical protein
MTNDERDILEVLRFELAFLEDGGYGRSPRTPWRAAAIFEDSPSCLNFSDPARPHPCSSCLLEKFVPENRRSEDVPCRFIELTKSGQTIEEFYRMGKHAEMEEALAQWLRAQIAKIENERAATGKQGAA